MLSRFYKKHSAAVLWLVALSFPYFFIQSHALRQNNNIETWLPKESPVRLRYEQFKKQFGVEEFAIRTASGNPQVLVARSYANCDG